MPQSPPKAWKFLLALLVAAAAVAGAVFLVSSFPPKFPELPVLDVTSAGVAGKVERFSGKVLISGVEKGEKPGLASSVSLSAKEGQVVGVPSAFQLGAGGGRVEVSIEGGWAVKMEGEGEFFLLDARTDAPRSRRSTTWTVQRGRFAARPQTPESRELWLEIRVPVGRILVRQGEVGVSIEDNGHGQAWLVSGRAWLVREDGTRIELKTNGMESL